MLLAGLALVLAVALSGTKGSQRVETIRALRELLEGVGSLFVEIVRMILPPYRAHPDRLPGIPVELSPPGEPAPDSPSQGAELSDGEDPLDGGPPPLPVEK